MRPRFEKVDPERVSKRELAEKCNALVDELERTLCHIGEDNLDVNLRKKIGGEGNG